MLVLDLKTMNMIRKYEGVAGYPVDLMVKYQKFLRDGKENGVDVSDVLYFWNIRITVVIFGKKVSEKDAFFFCYAARLLSIFIFKTSLVFSIISFGKVILQK